jgi:preprotein translocase subunit SecG
MIFIVLIQGGKGADLGAAFGSVGQANSARSGMTGVGKITAVCAATFFVTSMSLAILSTERADLSVIKDVQATSASAMDPSASADHSKNPMTSGSSEMSAEAESATDAAGAAGAAGAAIEQSDAPAATDSAMSTESEMPSTTP